MCIGAQRAGTTWLYDNLVVHPRVWLPPIKEVHFFDALCPHEELLGVESNQDPRGLGKWGPLWSRPSAWTFRWLHRYFSSTRTTQWYYRIFETPSEDLVSGDITPAYSTLDERGVRFAARVLDPGCKLFMILRNPIERAWSGLKLTYRASERDISAMDLKGLTKAFDYPTHRLRSDYVGTVRRWKELFDDRFETFLYEDLTDDPRSFLVEIQKHLGLEPYANESSVGQRSNADRGAVGMPPSVREFLEARYVPEIKKLERLIPGVEARWLKGGGA